MANSCGCRFFRFAAGALLAAATLSGAPKNKVFAPVFVGRPPSDAYIGLSRLPSGEIRHYNYGEQAESEDGTSVGRCETRSDSHSRLPGGEIRDGNYGKPADWEDPFYIVSFDNGVSWQRRPLPKGSVAADQRSPVSGKYIRLFSQRGGGVAVARSKGGIDGEYDVRKVWPESGGMLKPPVFIRGGKRILVGCQFREKGEGLGYRAGTFYSDDDALTWKLSSLVSAPLHRPGGVHKSARWQNGAVESTVVELKDGRIWMLMRTSQDNHYESFSRDGGETWEEARPSRFYATLTMPTVGRLKDGRILLLWNNTTALPEVAREESDRFFLSSGVLDGSSEDVFTNRDVIHAAISADEGRTWQGFRELYLNARRNDRDFAETCGIDRSVHQSQFVDLDDGSVLVSLGQHWLHRSLVVFHPDWLLAKTRSSNFENGLTDWSVHMFIAGIRGHCAFNRKVGADLIEHPSQPARKVLRIRRPKDRSLVSENQGAVWNFPAGSAGTFTVKAMFQKGGQGGRISLLDRWVNPTDPVVDGYAMFNFSVRGDGTVDGSTKLTPGQWHEVKFEWNGLQDLKSDSCRVRIDGVLQAGRLPLNRPSPNGISYVHFQSTATAVDSAGFLLESVAAEVK